MVVPGTLTQKGEGGEKRRYGLSPPPAGPGGGRRCHPTLQRRSGPFPEPGAHGAGAVCTPGVCPSPRFWKLIQEPGPSFPNGTKSTLRAQVDLFLSPKSIRVYVAMVTRKLFGGVGRKWDWLHLWPVGLHCGKGGAIM